MNVNNSFFVHTILSFEPLYIVQLTLYVAPQILFPRKQVIASIWAPSLSLAEMLFACVFLSGAHNYTGSCKAVRGFWLHPSQVHSVCICNVLVLYCIVLYCIVL